MTPTAPDFLGEPSLTVQQATQEATGRTVADSPLFNEKAERRAGRFRAVSLTLLVVGLLGLAAAPAFLFAYGADGTTGSAAIAAAGVVTLIMAAVFGRAARRTEWFGNDLDGHAGFFRDLSETDVDVDALWDEFGSNRLVYTLDDIKADRATIMQIVAAHADPAIVAAITLDVDGLPLPYAHVPTSPVDLDRD